MARRIPVEELPLFNRERLPTPSFNYHSGAAFLVDKPKGWTSFDVVELVRNRTHAKTGHAGTLDPMAEGLLILCCGKGTKSIEFFQQRTKYYYGEITLGASTASFDAETEVKEEAPYDHVDEEQIKQVLEKEFQGDITQYPPIYSAIKHKGRRMYELAREGKDVKAYPRIVSIYDIKLIDYNPPVIKLQIECGTGTYIRSIAHDLGIALKTRGHLSKLTRTQIGEFKNEDALTIDQIKKAFQPYG